MGLSDAFHHRIKAAQRDLIARSGGIMRVAEITSFSKSEVGRWNNPNEPAHMPLAAAVALEDDTGVALVTSVMAEANGRRLSDPAAQRAAEISLMQAQAETMRQFADLMHANAVAAADGKFTPTEAMTCDRIAATVEAALSNYRNAMAGVKAHGSVSAGLQLVGDDEA